MHKTYQILNPKNGNCCFPGKILIVVTKISCFSHFKEPVLVNFFMHFCNALVVKGVSKQPYPSTN